MRITTTIEGNVLTAVVTGRLDAHTVDRYVESVVDAVGAETPNVALDMSGVEFMDSSALAAMVRTLKRCIELGGSIVLIAVSDSVRIILELTRLNEVFPQVGSLVEVPPVISSAGAM